MKRSAAVQAVVIVIAFMIPRLAFLIDFPFPVVTMDSPTYYSVVQLMDAGRWEWPSFIMTGLEFPWPLMRAPGFPLFLAGALAIHDDLMTVVIAQCVVTLASSLFLWHAATRLFPRMGYLITAAMVLHVAQPFLAARDTMIMTESLYTGLLNLSLGCLLLAFRSNRTRDYLAFAIFGALAILTRQSGGFLFGILALVAIVMLANRHRWSVLAVMLPMPAMVLGLMIYNQLVSGEFIIARLNIPTLFPVTSLFWETSRSFPDRLNAVIEEHKAEVAPHAKMMASTWDFKPLLVSFHAGTGVANFLFYATKKVNFQEAQEVASHAVRRHPFLYLKWVYAWTCEAFDKANWSWGSPWWEILIYYKWQYIDRLSRNPLFFRDGEKRSPLLFRNRVDFYKPPGYILTRAGGLKVATTPLYRLTTIGQDIGRKIVSPKPWIWLYFAALAYGLMTAARSRFRDRRTTGLFAIALFPLGANIFTALFIETLYGYSAPTFALQYLAVFLAAGDLVRRGLRAGLRPLDGVLSFFDPPLRRAALIAPLILVLIYLIILSAGGRSDPEPYNPNAYIAMIQQQVRGLAGEDIGEMVSNSAGTPIGNLVGYGGLAASFDNNVNKVATSCSAHPLFQTPAGGIEVPAPRGYNNFIGKDWGSGVKKKIVAFRLFPPINNVAMMQGAGINLKLQGSNDNVAWTDLFIGTGLAPGRPDNLSVTIGIDSSTAYRFHRVNIEGNGVNAIVVCQVQFDELP